MEDPVAVMVRAFTMHDVVYAIAQTGGILVVVPLRGVNVTCRNACTAFRHPNVRDILEKPDLARYVRTLFYDRDVRERLRRHKTDLSMPEYFECRLVRGLGDAHVVCTAERLAFVLGVSRTFVREHLQRFRVDAGHERYHLYSVSAAAAATVPRIGGWWALFARWDSQARGESLPNTRMSRDPQTVAALHSARRLFATTWHFLSESQRRIVLRQLRQFVS